MASYGCTTRSGPTCHRRKGSQGWRATRTAPRHHSIGAVARMLGVPAQTLRAWRIAITNRACPKRRWAAALQPRPGGSASFIRNQIALGMQPADAHRLLAEQHHKDAASTPVDQRRIAGASVDAATTTVLLAERDPYAAGSPILPTHRGLCGSDRARPRRAAEILRDDPPSVLVVDLLICGAQVWRCAGLRETTVRSRSSPSPR